MPHDATTGPHSHAADPYDIDWAESVPRLRAAARTDGDWTTSVAAALVRPGDRIAVDVGCGGGGMTLALAEALGSDARVIAVDGSPEVLAAARAGAAEAATRAAAEATAAEAAGLAGIEFVLADLHGGFEPVRAALDGPADIIWASASVHHLGDQQAGVAALAGLLAPGGRLALAEGGAPPQCLPWDVGVGEPGLEVRLAAAQDRWFGRMRARLPGSVPMPYGWTEALRRTGLDGIRTMSWLIERPAPLPPDRRGSVVAGLARRVRWLDGTELLEPGDAAAWDRLLDEGDPAWLGNRDDLYHLEVRSVHVGARR